MKNRKKYTSALFFVLVISLTIFSSCKKDDENSSSPGYLKINGEKYNLDKALYEYCEEGEFRGVKYIQHGVYFLSKDIPTKEEDILLSRVPIKGAFVLFQCMDPLLVKTPAAGEYKYQSDGLAPKAYTYFDFSIGYSSDFRQAQDTTISKYLQLHEIVKVNNEGEIYEFKSVGKTDNGKPYEFYYKGTLMPGDL